MKIEHRSPMHLDRQNAQLGTKHGVHCRLTMGLMISTTCLYSNFDLINHIYKKKNGCSQHQQQTRVSSCYNNTIGRSETIWFYPQQKRTENNINIYFTVTQLRPRCQVSTP